VSLTKLGRYEEAIACYDKALENDPRLDKAWSNKGTISYNLGRFEEAIACFNKALEINPNSKKARELKQSSLRRLGEEM
jgi:tetratricopeptide (TPR) repeat protein